MLGFRNWLVRFGSRVVEGNLDSNLSGILAPARQRLPHVILAASRNNDALQVNPSLADEVCSFIISKDGHFKLVVVG